MTTRSESRWQAIGFRLPVLISVLLLAVLGVAGWVGYRSLGEALRVTTGERLSAVVSLFSNQLSLGATQVETLTRQLAEAPGTVAFLTAPGPGTRAAFLDRLSTPVPSAMAPEVEVWDSAGRCLLRAPRGAEARAGDRPCRADLGAARTVNGPRLAPIRVVDSTGSWEVHAAVRDPGGRVIGTLVERRLLTISPPGIVSRLIGPDARLLFGNVAGGPWNDLTREQPGPALSRSSERLDSYRDESGARHLGWALQPPGTPWLVWLDLPESLVLRPARLLLQRIQLLALLIGLVGIAAGLLIARSITVPLRALTDATATTTGLAEPAPLVVTRRDELGRLATAFNAMTSRVAEGRRALEERLEERTAELAERRRLESQLRTSEERVRLLLENLSEMILVIDDAGRAGYVSRSVGRVLGRSPEEFDGHRWRELVHPEDRPLAADLGAAALGRDRLTPRLRFRHQDGSWRLLEIMVADLRANPAIGGLVVTGRDLTERSVLEQQLQQSRKMEAIGSLAGGIAHDFNNLLMVIGGHAEILLRTGPTQVRTEVGEINKAAERAANLTRQLLAFSRRQVLEPKVVDLNALIGGLERMLTRIIGEDVVLETVLDSSSPRVKADPGQVEQVVVNLVANARDAMPTGGRVTIETGLALLDAEYARTHLGVTPGRHAMIAVTDTGTGMDEATQAHIFEPFFSTKPAGKGTGLGLATVYGIVKQTGGNIWFYSEPGKGTTFKIYLPAVDAPATLTPIPESAPARGTETVLVVEDETAVRQLIVRFLSGLGYRVLEGTGPASGLELGASYPGTIDLLLTDVVMPGISGTELAARILVNRPAIKVLFMSGYTDDAVVRHGVLQAGVPFLQKPFTIQSLAAKVRQVLDVA